MGQTILTKAKYALVALLFTAPLPAELALRGAPVLHLVQLAFVFLSLCFLSWLMQSDTVSTALPVVMSLMTAAFAVGVNATEGAINAAWFILLGLTYAWCLRSVRVTRYEVTPGVLMLSTLPVLALLAPSPWERAATSVLYAFVAAVLTVADRYFSRPLLSECGDVASAIEAQEINDVKISVVLPSYNAGERLLQTAEGVHAALQHVRHEVIIVDDGSTDSSCLFDPAEHGVRLLHKSNGGKGSAIAAGVLSASGEWVAFLDADGDISPAHLSQFLHLAETTAVTAVVGSKKVAGSLAHTAWYRRLFSIGFQSLQRVLLRTGVKDSQVGCKLVKREWFTAAILNSRERGFLLDLELLTYLHRSGKAVVESPVHIAAQGSTTVSSKTVVRMFVGVLTLSASRVCRSGVQLNDANTAVLENALSA
jgi:hypothetical protein